MKGFLLGAFIESNQILTPFSDLHQRLVATGARNQLHAQRQISRSHGGPDHMDNMALAHEKCNFEAANWPLVVKIKMHVEARRGK